MQAPEAHQPGNLLRWLRAFSPFLINVCAQWKAAIKCNFANLPDQLNAQPLARRMTTLAPIVAQSVGIIRPEKPYFGHFLFTRLHAFE